MIAQLAGDRVDPLGLRAVGRLGEEALDADGPLCQRQDPRLCPNARWVYGLGLHAASEAASAHGGSVSLANSPSGGAVATIAVPLCGI